MSIGNLAILTLVAGNLIAYAIAVGTFRLSEYPVQLIAEVFSSSAMILISCAIVLSNRPRFLERFFGGLDRMYRSHRLAGLAGLVLLFLHFFTIPDLSASNSAGRTLGKLALIGLTTLVALALIPRIPFIGGYLRLAYQHWRFTHRLIGVFFIVGFIHMVPVDDITSTLPLARWYWHPIVFVGMAAYVYKELVAPRRRNRHREYVVEEARRLNASVIDIALRPRDRGVRQRAGQFAFIGFPEREGLAEQHPFTISSGPDDELLRFSIKASGDWTRHLYRTLAVGDPARIDGSYGGFSYRTGRPRQIWVAGGIGITPFLSWIRDFGADATDVDIDLFYTVGAQAEAPFWREVRFATRRRAWFRASLNVSSENGQLSAERIATEVDGDLDGRSVFLCGPVPMVESMRSGFRRLGVPASQIRSEEFGLR